MPPLRQKPDSGDEDDVNAARWVPARISPCLVFGGGGGGGGGGDEVSYRVGRILITAKSGQVASSWDRDSQNGTSVSSDLAWRL